MDDGVQPIERRQRRRRRRTRADGPDPLDIHIGARIRLRRNIERMSQSELADQLGMSFQNVQKYERAGNRVSASALWRVAEILKVPVSFFFEGFGDAGYVPPDPELEEAMVQMAKLFREIPTPIRLEITRLITTIAQKTAQDGNK